MMMKKTILFFLIALSANVAQSSKALYAFKWADKYPKDLSAKQKENLITYLINQSKALELSYQACEQPYNIKDIKKAYDEARNVAQEIYKNKDLVVLIQFIMLHSTGMSGFGENIDNVLNLYINALKKNDDQNK